MEMLNFLACPRDTLLSMLDRTIYRLLLLNVKIGAIIMNQIMKDALKSIIDSGVAFGILLTASVAVSVPVLFLLHYSKLLSLT